MSLSRSVPVASLVLVLVLVLLGCGCGPMPAGYAPGQTTEAPVPPPAAGEQPAVDDRNAGQVIVDILVSQAYVCTAEESRWSCLGPQQTRPTYVSFVEEAGQITIWFDSYEHRAFGRPCSEFVNAMKDLSTSENFSASCDDTTQLFRMNTRFAYGPGLDVMPWVQAHETGRDESLKLLDSIGALRKR